MNDKHKSSPDKPRPPELARDSKPKSHLRWNRLTVKVRLTWHGTKIWRKRYKALARSSSVPATIRRRFRSASIIVTLPADAENQVYQQTLKSAYDLIGQAGELEEDVQIWWDKNKGDPKPADKKQSSRGSWAWFQPPARVGSFTPELMLLLTDGSVLIHDAADGRGTNNWIRLTPDSTGNYRTGIWSSLLPMANTRQYFSSAVLRDGQVYVMGGEYSNAGDGSGDTPLGEIFDPQTNTWSPMNKPVAFNWIQGDAPGAVLPDGRVLFGNLDELSPPFSTAIWNPATDDWTEAGSGFRTLTTDTRQNSNCTEETWTLLPDGSVLAADVYGEPHTERYVPSIDEWVSTGTPPAGLVITKITDSTGVNINVSEIGPAILLPNGRVFVIGGTGQTALYTPPPAGSDPKTNPGTWAAGPAFPDDIRPGAVWPTLTAADAPAVLQTNGKVLCVAGNLSELDQGKPDADYMSQNMTFLEFDPATSQLTDFSPVPFNSSGAPWAYTARFLLLPTGQILLTSQDTVTHKIYIYTPDATDNPPLDAWRPTIIEAPSVLTTGNQYTITGTQFNGLSQAVSYGDDAQMATNYPIVRLSNTSGDVTYLRSFNFSTMAVATGTQRVSTSIEVPLTVTPGTWQMSVIANGIASQPVDVKVAAGPGTAISNGVTPEMEEAPVTDVTVSQDHEPTELPTADE